MAEFDPALQNLNDPSYTRDSRGVDVPRTPGPDGQAQNQILPKGVDTPDRSAEFLGKAAAYGAESSGASSKGLGDLFAGIVGIGDFAFKAGDALIKKDIDRQVYDLANQEREQYTAQLEGQLAKTGKKSIFDANAQMTENVPGELEDLPDTLAQLQSAQSAGKISNTYYTGKLLAHAKDLRARYPEYREYIDQQFSSVTGMNPANARVQALTQEINRAMSSQVGTQKAMITAIGQYSGYSSGGIDSRQAMQKVYSGEWTTMQDVENWRYPIAHKEAYVKTRQQEFALEKGDRASKAQRADDAAKAFLAKSSDDVLESIMSKFEVKDVHELRLKLKEDRPVKWWQDRAVEFEYTKELFEETMFKAMNSPQKDEKGKPIPGSLSMAQAMNMTPAAVREYVSTYTKPIDNILKSIKAQDANGIAGGANRIKTMQDETIEFMYKAPYIRDFALAGNAAKQIFGDNSQIAKELAERGFNEDFKGRYKDAMRAHSEWLSLGGVMPNQQTPSFNRVFEELKNKGMLSNNDAKVFVNKVHSIADSKISDEEKYSLALSAFGERNSEFISKHIAAKDQRGTFESWTADGIAKEIKRLDSNPKYRGIWNQYTNWTVKTATSDLLASDIATLKNLDKEDNFAPHWGISANGIRQIKFAPTSRNPESLAQQRRMAGGKLPRENELIALENRFNSVLRRFSVIANESGDDPDAFIFRALAPVLDKGPLADKIAKAINTTRNPPKENNAGR
jgi:hypothetical protein